MTKHSNNHFIQHSGVKYPIICGPMYPCSNPELVAAVSRAGGLGVIQPISLTYVHGYDFAAGIDYIRSLTDQPVGMNLLIEKSSRKYHQRLEYWLDVALERGIKFFITSLGKPDWVVKKAHDAGAFVYHDVTESKWAQKAVDTGIDGLIAVNNRAGGHAGIHQFHRLFEDLHEYDLPVVCAGGISNVDAYCQALNIGYQAVQMGTRFIVSSECNASLSYKQAIIKATEKDIVLTERITGVPVSVINTPYVQKKGLTPNNLEGWMLKHPRFKYIMRTILALKSMRSLRMSLSDQTGHSDYWQAGKSVEHISSILTVEEIIDSFVKSPCKHV